MKKVERMKRHFGSIFPMLVSLVLIAALCLPAFATVFTNPAAITINDAVTIGTGNPYPSNISVSGLTGNITDIKVNLFNINHSFPDDMDLLLVGPTGANIIIMSDNGGSDDRFNVDITLDDAAAASLPDATTLPSGTFKPTNIGAGDTWPAPAPAPSANTTLAAAFAGTAPNGTWSLYVGDDLGADMGGLGNGWGLTITTSGNPATNFFNVAPITGGDGARGRASTYASTITASGLSGAITDVNVTLTGLSHLNPDDIDILLVGPSGKSITLLSDAGGTTDVVTQNLTFDDAAAATTPDAGPMVTGTFKPTNFGTGDTIPDVIPPYPNAGSAGAATLASVFNGTEPNGVWKIYIVDDATTSAGDIAGGWSIDITAGGTYGPRRFTSTDFDGDGKSDTAVFKSSTNTWFVRDSSTYNKRAHPWGLPPGDKPVIGDFDGDRKTDLAVFRTNNANWIIFNSSTSTFTITQWGVSTDTVTPADYDGDGKTDIAVRRASNGNFYVRQSSTLTMRTVNWGTTGDIPVAGNFNGTNGADFTVFRPSDNTWYILNNAGTSFVGIQWGTSGDKLVPGDYDGDNKTDVAVYRPSDSNWYVLQSSNSSLFGFHLGASGDVAVPGDYDGDSVTDFAVYRAAGGGNWFIYNSGTAAVPGSAGALRLDSNDGGDIPVGTFYLPN